MSDLVPVIRSDAHLAHAGLIELASGVEIPCFESPERIIAIEAALTADGGYAFEAPAEHGRAPILAVHDADMVDVFEHAWTDALAAGATDGSRAWLPDTFLLAAYRGPMSPSELPAARHHQLGAYLFDTATPIVAGTWGASLAAVDVAVSAAERVVGGAGLVYGLCRPPGHHAARGMLGGYCYFNNAAIVAEWFRREGGARRVAILDIDYHHGNGTQQIFWERGDVLYLSLHADPARAYPYFSGYASERGDGDGAGRTRNWPLAERTGLDGYALALAEALDMAAAFAPDAPLVISAGFDTFERDPIGDLALRTADYAEIGRMIAAVRMPTIVLQEGGYAVDALGLNVVALLSGLRGA
ncbi:MAG TPA: histone deacetylase family protein [Candidatus Limnocylindria bacterium]|nr:histone deacetylase family protein [Candidatus Limnocylindria bacterium]